jgi:hypothetical protein
MKRVLIAHAMIAASVFIASPAIAQEDATDSTDPGTSTESTTEATTPPPAQEPPATENLPTPPDSESSEPSPERREDAEVGILAQDPDKIRNITICHRTNSVNNPYNEITVSANSIVKNNGHDSHDGQVFEPGLKDLGIEWGDIIPEFDFDNGQQHYDGQNLGDGADILANGCLVPGEPPPGEDDDDGGDDDGDDDKDDGDGDKGGSLPDTGGDSPWILLTGGLLTVIGIAIVNSNGPMGRHTALAGRHIKI